MLTLAEAGARKQAKSSKSLKQTGRYPPGTEYELVTACATILLGLTNALRFVLYSDISWIMWMLTRNIYTSSTATASRIWVIFSACRSSVGSLRCITPLILYSPVPYRYAINRLPDLIPLLLQLSFTDICLPPVPTENSRSKHPLPNPLYTSCLT